jgi:hypothetical protein
LVHPVLQSKRTLTFRPKHIPENSNGKRVNYRENELGGGSDITLCEGLSGRIWKLTIVLSGGTTNGVVGLLGFVCLVRTGF